MLSDIFSLLINLIIDGIVEIYYYYRETKCTLLMLSNFLKEICTL